jgi:hypothetical protein
VRWFEDHRSTIYSCPDAPPKKYSTLTRNGRPVVFRRIMPNSNGGAPMAPTPQAQKHKKPTRRKPRRVYLSFEAFSSLLPLPVTEDAFLYWARMGSAPKAFRVTRKGTPVWRVSHLIEWVWIRFGKDFQDRCKSFEVEVKKLKSSTIGRR